MTERDEMKEAKELREALGQYVGGTDGYHRAALNRRMVITDGVRHFAENASTGAFWFLDIVATEIEPKLEQAGGFACVVLFQPDAGQRAEGRKPTITADDGDGNVFHTRALEWTTCPPGEWKFFLEGGGPAGTNVLMLPGDR